MKTGCQLCHSWYHLACLNLEEDKVKKMSSFICQKCRETYGSELEDEEEYLEEEDEESIDDEENIDDEESIGDESDSGHQLIISEPAPAQPQPQQQSTVKIENNDNSLVIENSKSNELVQKVSPSSKRKATSMNSDLLADKAVVKQAMNGTVKAVRKKQTTTTKSKQQKQEAVEEEDDSQLYCICRTPYNESQFYVQCESASCLEWYHGGSQFGAPFFRSFFDL